MDMMKSVYKNIFLSTAIPLAITACDKQSIQQTTNTIKQADSLFTNVNKGYKTLDSISKIMGDSTKVGNEIRKQKEVIERNISLKNLKVKNLDSLAGALKKVSKNINNSKDVIKTIDSASNALKNSKNPVEALSTISKALEKVSEQTKVQKKSKPTDQSQNPSENSEDEQDTYSENTYEENSAENKNQYENQTYTDLKKDPIIKSAKLEITVDNISEARNQLALQLRDYGADIVTDSYTDSEGTKKQYIMAKVPYRNFDESVADISKNLGTTTSKTIESEGIDKVANQMCDISITFRESGKYEGSDLPTGDHSIKDENKPAESNSKSWTGLKDVMMALLPFWPIPVIAGVAGYFITRNRRKKLEAELERQRAYNAQLQAHNAETVKRDEPVADARREYQRPESATQGGGKKQEDGDDYSRFMPK